MSITFNFRLPIYRQAQRRPSSSRADLATTWLRARRWIVATAKQAVPAIAVIALFAAVLAATIALRLAIWLPLHFRP